MSADKETTAAVAEATSVEAPAPAAAAKEAEVGEKRKAEEAPEGDAEKKCASFLLDHMTG